MSKKGLWVAIVAVLAVMIIAVATFWPRTSPTTGATAVPTVTASASSTPTQSATTSPSATSSAKTTVSTTPTASSSKPSTHPTTSTAPAIDTSNWPKPEDCSGRTPPPEHIAFCKVPGKTQVQVLEACKAAALGTLWESSHKPKLGLENPRLVDDIETCVRGSGLEKNSDSSTVLAGIVKGQLRYVLVAGVDIGLNEASRHVFDVTGAGSDIGFISFDETELLVKIDDFYAELT